jgi:hypothetical protein
MKTLFPMLVLFSCAVSSLAAGTDYSVVSVGPHHRVWQQVVPSTDARGRASYTTNSYVELASGMYRQDPRSGQYVECNAAIGLGAGIAIGKSIQFADTLIYGGEVNATRSTVSRLLHAIYGADDLWKMAKGIPIAEAEIEAQKAGAVLLKGSRLRGTRVPPGTNKIVVSPSDLKNGEMNRIMLAEEIQHVWDGAAEAATAARNLGRTLEEFHAEVFGRVMQNWKSGQLKFLTAEDIDVIEKQMIPFLSRRVL